MIIACLLLTPIIIVKVPVGMAKTIKYGSRTFNPTTGSGPGFNPDGRGLNP